MLSREEFAILQNQLVQLNDERNSLRTEIATLKLNIQQIPQLKLQLNDAVRLKQSEENDLLNEMSKLQQKISVARSEIQQESDLSFKGAFNDVRLGMKEEKLQELNQTDKKLTQALDAYNQKLDQYKNKLTAISNSIQAETEVLNFRLRNYKKIKSFSTINMKLFDYEAQFEQYRNITAKLSQDKIELDQKYKNFNDLNLILKSQLNEKETEFSKVNKSIDEELKILNSSTELLDLVKYEYEGLKNALETTLSDANNQSTSDIDKLENEIGQMKKKIQENKIEISKKKQEIEQIKLEHGIMEHKKVAMINQLQKVVNEKVTEISSKLNSSSEVQDIIALQEQHWVDKEVARQEYLEVSKNHDSITKDVARKSLILTELKLFMKGLPPAQSHYPLDELSNIYDLANAENRRLAKSIANATENRIKLEKEINWLKTQL